MLKRCALIVIISIVVFSGPAMALSAVDAKWECSKWKVDNVGQAKCVVEDEGCKVEIEGSPYTLYNVVSFPSKARYLLEWNVELESTLVSGAAGLAIGNDSFGLIFQVSDRGIASVRSYRNGKESQARMTKTIPVSGNEFVQTVSYDIRERRCAFRVNEREVFDFSTRDFPNMNMPSNVRRIAVTTTLPEGGGKALALHKWVKVRAQ